jgi:hypothetical protein
MNCNNCENFKPTTGRVINTTYDIGDTFWIMANNRPIKVCIYKISIVIESVNSDSTCSEKYCLKVVGNNGNFYDQSVTELNKMCRTKEELMKKVFA